ncbi:hypothetical protein ABFT80_06100 [Mesorhizobium sp. SB112]|uniref:hypothetical protein n=1 Tax=Mesorhizobium sp. SB112 TaxID=3151853 RepID=UPI0032645E02
MTGQLNLFAWADTRPSNVVDAMPALIRKAAMETIYKVPRPQTGGNIVTDMRRTA